MVRVWAGVLGLVFGICLGLAPLLAVASYSGPSVAGGLAGLLENHGAVIGQTEREPALNRTVLSAVDWPLAGGGALTVDSLVYDGALDAPGTMRLSGVSLRLADGSTFSAKGMALTGARLVSGDAESAPRLVFDRAEAVMAAMTGAAPLSVTTLTLEHGALRLGGGPGGIIELDPVRTRMAADGIDIAAADLKAVLPRTGAFAGLGEMIAAMGFERINANGAIGLTGDVLSIEMDADGLGALMLSADIAFDETAGSEPVALAPGLMLGARGTPSIAAMSLDYTDTALAKRALDLMAAQHGTEAEVIGTRMAMGLALSAALLGPETAARLEPLTAGLSDFLRKPERLRVSVTSEMPISAHVLSSGKAIDPSVLKGLTVDARSGGQ